MGLPPLVAPCPVSTRTSFTGTAPATPEEPGRSGEAVGEARREPDPSAGLGQLSSAATSPPGTAVTAGAAAAGGDGIDQERAAGGPSPG